MFPAIPEFMSPHCDTAEAAAAAAKNGFRTINEGVEIITTEQPPSPPSPEALEETARSTAAIQLLLLPLLLLI